MLCGAASITAPHLALAQSQSRPSAVVARVIVDPAITPPRDFPSILRRELELGLDRTGLFTIPTRDEHELNAVLDEIERTRGRGAPARSVDTIVAPTITSVELVQRRRTAPFQQQANRDILTTSGQIQLQITVMNARDASVISRFPLQATYRDEGRLVDHVGNAGTEVADSNSYVLLAREAGKALENYMRARNPSAAVNGPTLLVADRDGSRIFLTPSTGLAIGDELRVFAAGGREIRNPQTGVVVGVVETEIGRVRVTELQSQMAIAEIVSSTTEIAAGANAHR